MIQRKREEFKLRRNNSRTKCAVDSFSHIFVQAVAVHLVCRQIYEAQFNRRDKEKRFGSAKKKAFLKNLTRFHSQTTVCDKPTAPVLALGSLLIRRVGGRFEVCARPHRGEQSCDDANKQGRHQQSQLDETELCEHLSFDRDYQVDVLHVLT